MKDERLKQRKETSRHYSFFSAGASDYSRLQMQSMMMIHQQGEERNVCISATSDTTRLASLECEAQ